MTVTIERDGAVWTVILDRHEVRNAVDRRTAEALADAFEAFEADPAARVGVLTGAGGTFCSGADLKALAAELAELPWECLVSDRRAVYDGLGRPPARAMEREFRHGMETVRPTGLADVEGFVGGEAL